MIIWYVHGAGASERSFAWLRDQLPPHTSNAINYTTNDSAGAVAQRLADMLAERQQPTILVGHSLGGLIVSACASSPWVTSLVTLCAPFGGVRHADFLSLFSFAPLIHDLRSHSPLLQKIRSTQTGKPHLAITGSCGLPFTSEPNDGVITVASQRLLVGPSYHDFRLNHFEVLLSEEVSTTISEFLESQ